MRKLQCVLIILLVLTLAEHVFSQPENTSSLTISSFDYNLTPDSVLSPKEGSRFRMDFDTIKVRIVNVGAKAHPPAKAVLFVRDVSGVVYHNDTAVVPPLNSGEKVVVRFKKGPLVGSRLYATINVLSSNDELQTDDTIRTRFYWGYEFDVSAVSITSPLFNVRITYGTAFGPSATFRWDGDFDDNQDIPVRVHIRHCENRWLAYMADTILWGLKMDVNSSVTFPSKQGNYDIASLPAGCYEIAIMARASSKDVDPTNDTVFSNFSIVDPSITTNIIADGILDPANGSNASLNPIRVRARFHSNGMNDLSTAPISFVLKDVTGSEIYRNTIIEENFKSMEVRNIIFPDCILPDSIGRGVLTASVFAHAPNDQFPNDDTATAISFFRGHANDVELLQITYPKPDEEIIKGTNFRPSGMFRWIGGMKPPSNVSLKAIIRTCDLHQVRLTLDTTLTKPLGTELPSTFILPFKQLPNHGSGNLNPGCYTLTMIAANANDTFNENDTLHTTFTITATGDVKENSSELALAQSYPNPATDKTSISFSLKQPGYASVRITDITGRTLIASTEQYFTEGEHALDFDVADLAAGPYTYELSFTGANGHTQRLARTLAIVR